MLKPGAAAPPPAAQLAEVDSTGRGCQPAHSPLFPRGLALWHQASNLLRPGTSVSSGPGQGGEGSQGRFRPGRQGPQWSVACASSRSCCTQGWPDLCRGHRPRVEIGAQPPRRAARTYGQNGAGTESLSCHQATASVTSGRDSAPCLGALGKEKSPWWGCGTRAQEEAEAWGRMWQGVASRGFVILHGLLDEFSPGVDCEDA